tara:strand:- start:43 stop:336 length:294 start_codon:yes stop_codon:yes gene_type:complete
MNSTPTIQSIIKTHLKSGNIEYLEPALELGAKKGINPALLKKGFVAVGDHYLSKDSTVQAIISYEKARTLVPYHAETVNKLFQTIDEFWSQINEKDI